MRVYGQTLFCVYTLTHGGGLKFVPSFDNFSGSWGGKKTITGGGGNRQKKGKRNL